MSCSLELLPGLCQGRGEVTGPSVWDGYAVAAVCEAGVRALEEGGRVEVELVERPALYDVS